MVQSLIHLELGSRLAAFEPKQWDLKKAVKKIYDPTKPTSFVESFEAVPYQQIYIPRLN